MSSLPIGINKVEINRCFTTIELAAFMPFTTQELFMPYSTYYGLNSISNNMILLNRKSLKSGNGLILGLPGGGKSFAAKREILDTFSEPMTILLSAIPNRNMWLSSKS